MKKGQRAQTGDEGENLAHQRPASAFSGGGSVEREESQGGNVQEERRAIFFPPSLPPQGGRKWTGVLIVVKREE